MTSGYLSVGWDQHIIYQPGMGGITRLHQVTTKRRMRYGILFSIFSVCMTVPMPLHFIDTLLGLWPTIMKLVLSSLVPSFSALTLPTQARLMT